MQTMSSRKLNQNINEAKKAALNSPVIITNRGTATHVLLSIEEYERIAGKQKSLLEHLAMPEAADIMFEPDTIQNLLQQAEFE